MEGTLAVKQHVPFFQDYDNAPYSLQINRPPSAHRAAKLLQGRSMWRIRDYLNSMTTSSSPTQNIEYTRVSIDDGAPSQGTSVANGGKRGVETRTLQTSGTNYTQGDVDTATLLAQYGSQARLSFPNDKSGNGGGGKLNDSAFGRVG